MRVDWALGLVTLLTAASAAGIDPRRHVERIDSNAQTDEQDLYKRRGGGGGGGRGGGSSGGGGGSRGGGSSGGNRGSGGSGGGGGGGGGRTGGGGVGPQPSYGGGNYYGGGASRPYPAGSSSRGRAGAVGGIAALGLFTVGMLAFWPGSWYGGAYMYRYGREDNDSDNTTYTYYNITTDEQEERDILCGCADGADCGCEPNDDVMEELVGNGSYAALNKTIINVGSENGTDYFLINGTLPEGTELAGQDEDEEDSEDAGNSMRGLVEALGFWPATAAVACAVFLA